MDDLYRPLCLELVRPERFTDVSIYLKNNGNYVMYKSAGQPLSERGLGRLHDNGVDNVYLRCGDIEELYEQIEKELPGMLSDASVPIETKGKLLCSASANYISDLFDAPTKARDLDRCHRMVDSVMTFVMNTEEAQHAIEQVMAVGFNIYTHSVQVAALTVALHIRLYSLQHQELVEAAAGSYLHDFGIVYVPQKVLDRYPALSESERAIYNSHAEAGYDQLKSLGCYGDVALAIVRYHHALLDGSGCPDGLGGDAIPRSVQVTAVADAYSDFLRFAIRPTAEQRRRAIYELSVARESQYNQEVVQSLAGLVGVELPVVPDPAWGEA